MLVYSIDTVPVGHGNYISADLAGQTHNNLHQIRSESVYY